VSNTWIVTIVGGVVAAVVAGLLIEPIRNLVGAFWELLGVDPTRSFVILLIGAQSVCIGWLLLRPGRPAGWAQRILAEQEGDPSQFILLYEAVLDWQHLRDTNSYFTFAFTVVNASILTLVAGRPLGTIWINGFELKDFQGPPSPSRPTPVFEPRRNAAVVDAMGGSCSNT